MQDEYEFDNASDASEFLYGVFDCEEDVGEYEKIKIIFVRVKI